MINLVFKNVGFFIVGFMLITINGACSQKPKTVKLPINSSSKPVKCSDLPQVKSGDYKFKINVDGVDRSFNVHIPKGYLPNKSYPQVFSFHGNKGTGDGQAKTSLIREKADQEGFISIEPDGYGKSWNAGVCCDKAYKNKINDVKFVDNILSFNRSRYCVDEKRVYATGFSNGARMVHRLGCQMSDKFAAIAPIAAPIAHRDPKTKEVAFYCKPSRPIAVFQFQGMKDKCNPYNGGETGGGIFQIRNNLTVPQTILTWKRANQCRGKAMTKNIHPTLNCKAHSKCSNKSSVTLCTHQTAGHVWPGGKKYIFWKLCGGEWIDSPNMTNLIWDFFKKHSI